MEDILNGYNIALIAIFAFSTLTTICMVGKPREPITGGVAAGTLIVNGLLVWLALAG